MTEAHIDEPAVLRWIRQRITAAPTALEARMLGGVPRGLLLNTALAISSIAGLVGCACSVAALPALFINAQIVPTLLWVAVAALSLVFLAARVSQVTVQLHPSPEMRIDANQGRAGAPPANWSSLVATPLAEHYLEPPGRWPTTGELPEQEFEVLATLAHLRYVSNRVDRFSIADRLLRPEPYGREMAAMQRQHQHLMTLVNSSPEHKAAIRRIVNAMPPGDAGRWLLLPFTA